MAVTLAIFAVPWQFHLAEDLGSCGAGIASLQFRVAAGLAIVQNWSIRTPQEG